MRNLLTIFRRELGSYFNSAIAYIFLIVFVIFANGLFMLQFFQIGKADMRGLFNSLPFILNIFVPAISMRLWAEDKKGNTFELLLTFPMKPAQLVLGKYLASFVFYLFALATTLTVPIMLHFLGHADPGTVIGGYLGAILIGGLFLAIGIFISGLCKDQIVAFILTMIFTFAMFFIGTDAMAVFMDGWIQGFGTFIKNYIGMANHLVGFGKGVIDLRDIFYFIVMISVFLFLNGLSLEGRFRPKAKLVFSSAVAVCALSVILLNWLMRDLPLGRFDVTEGQLYTISDTSLKILKNLKVPVRVKLYVSPIDSLPTVLKTLEREVTDKLEELRIASNKKLQYRVIHLEPSQQEDESFKQTLQNEGIVPFQVESVQKDEVGVKLIYSTLVIEYKEKPQEIIPRVVPQMLGDLEYQLLSRIYKMTLEDKPIVAVFAPVKSEELTDDISKALSTEGKKEEKFYQDDYKTAMLLLRNNGYDTRRIALSKDDSIPDKASALLLMSPGELSDRQRYEINKFLYHGGTVIAAAQGYEYAFTREEKGIESTPKKQNLSLNRLFEKWGVKVNEDILLDENSQIISLTTGQTIGPFAVQMPVKFPNQIIVDESMINRSISITKRLPSLLYLWGSALEISDSVLKQSGLKSTVLFTSSPKSWTIPNNGENLTAEKTRLPEKDVKGKMSLAALIEGQFSDTFGGPAPVWKEGDPAETAKMDGPKPGRLLLVGCAKAFSEDLIQSPGNLNLFANIIDGLALGEDLVQIRSKTSFVRDIRRVTSGEKLWFKFLTVLLVPLILFVVALGRHLLRRKEKEFYLSAIKSQ